MSRWLVLVVIACATVAAACGSSGPAAPTPRTARLARTRFLAFGDSVTAGEVTVPIALRPGSGHAAAGGVGKLVVVPAASYPSVLQGQLASTYSAQASAITVSNMGVSNETLLEAVPRFDQVFPMSGAEVVLLQEGVNGLNLVGPDTSTGLMRLMVQQAKNGGARVIVGSMIPSVAGRSRSISAVALTTYNNVLQIMSTQESVTYVDLYNPMLADVATLVGGDGLHPTEAGYRKIADLFFAAIRAELEEK